MQPTDDTPSQSIDVLLQRLVGPSPRGHKLPEPELRKRLAFFILMTAHADALLNTFPPEGGSDFAFLKQQGWFTDRDLPADKVAALAGKRDALVQAQLAWRLFSEYEDPPCPSPGTYDELVNVLTGSSSS